MSLYASAVPTPAPPASLADQRLFHHANEILYFLRCYDTAWAGSPELIAPHIVRLSTSYGGVEGPSLRIPYVPMRPDEQALVLHETKVGRSRSLRDYRENMTAVSQVKHRRNAKARERRAADPLRREVADRRKREREAADALRREVADRRKRERQAREAAAPLRREAANRKRRERRATDPAWRDIENRKRQERKERQKDKEGR